MTEDYDIAVDFMDMTDDQRLWVHGVDVRTGFEPAVGRHAIVGDDDADPKVARIVAISAEGHVQLEVLIGPIEAYRDVLAQA